jgi:hypothetical protein
MPNLGKRFDAQCLVVMLADPGDGAADLAQAAVGVRDLAQLAAVRALQQAIENLALDEWAKDTDVAGAIE